MTTITNKSGQRYLATSVSLPVELVEQARAHGINRSSLLQTALKEEIARIEDEDRESGHNIPTNRAPGLAHPKRRTNYESTDC